MSGTAILAIVVVAYALVAAVLDRRSITAPLVFVTAGAVLGSEGRSGPPAGRPRIRVGE